MIVRSIKYLATPRWGINIGGLTEEACDIGVRSTRDVSWSFQTQAFGQASNYPVTLKRYRFFQNVPAEAGGSFGIIYPPRVWRKCHRAIPAALLCMWIRNAHAETEV